MSTPQKRAVTPSTLAALGTQIGSILTKEITVREIARASFFLGESLGEDDREQLRQLPPQELAAHALAMQTAVELRQKTEYAEFMRRQIAIGEKTQLTIPKQ